MVGIESKSADAGSPPEFATHVTKRKNEKTTGSTPGLAPAKAFARSVAKGVVWTEPGFQEENSSYRPDTGPIHHPSNLARGRS